VKPVNTLCAECREILLREDSPHYYKSLPSLPCKISFHKQIKNKCYLKLKEISPEYRERKHCSVERGTEIALLDVRSRFRR
jgi:hypothetical protein